MAGLLGVLGVLALVGGTIGYLAVPMGLSFGIRQAVNLAENGLVYPLYMNPPFPGRSDFRLFAVRNPREVLRGQRMELELKGPYVFDAWLVREDIQFKNAGERVEFGAGRKLVPRESESANFDERMWLLNPVLPTTVRTVKSMILDRVPFQRLTEPIVFNSVNLLLDTYRERLLVRTTPRQMLMGRKVELLESLTNLATRFGLASLLPPGLPDNIFGLAWVQNETIDKMEIYTGTGASKERFAEVSKWHGKSQMDIWQGKPCNTIDGTNGELYKPLVKEGKPIKIFLYPLCRSFYVEPRRGNGDGDGDKTTPGHVMTGSGMHALEYQVSGQLYLGARNNPANRCYCENTRAYDCQFDGLLNMGPCFFDVPLYFTRANFKEVDGRIKRLVDYSFIEQQLREGSQQLPDSQAFALEPLTGTVLELNLTLMAVFKVTRQPYMRDLSNVQNLTYAPLFASTESVSLPFKWTWQIYLLQKFADHHKLLMGGTALSGAAVLAFKWLFGV